MLAINNLFDELDEKLIMNINNILDLFYKISKKTIEYYDDYYLKKEIKKYNTFEKINFYSDRNDSKDETLYIYGEKTHDIRPNKLSLRSMGSLNDSMEGLWLHKKNRIEAMIIITALRTSNRLFALYSASSDRDENHMLNEYNPDIYYSNNKNKHKWITFGKRDLIKETDDIKDANIVIFRGRISYIPERMIGKILKIILDNNESSITNSKKIWIEIIISFFVKNTTMKKEAEYRVIAIDKSEAPSNSKIELKNLNFIEEDMMCEKKHEPKNKYYEYIRRIRG